MRFAEALAQAVAYVAEKIRGAFRVVRCRMRGARIPAETRNRHGLRQHRLTERCAREGSRVKARAGMEGIALKVGAFDDRVQKPKIKPCVVADQDGARAAVRVQGVAHFAEHSL